MIARLERPVRIEGHADPTPDPRPGGNWGLSAARAASVLRYFEEAVRVDPSLLTAVAYGSSRPIKHEDGSPSGANDRRVEVVFR